MRVNELRIGMQLNRSEEERFANPRGRPLTTDIGSLATYVAESNLSGSRLRCSDEVELEGLLHRFGGFSSDYLQNTKRLYFIVCKMVRKINTESVHSQKFEMLPEAAWKWYSSYAIRTDEHGLSEKVSTF